MYKCENMGVRAVEVNAYPTLLEIDSHGGEKDVVAKESSRDMLEINGMLGEITHSHSVSKRAHSDKKRGSLENSISTSLVKEVAID